ncbi:hypothetical protein Taro_032497 [Colocasia esculenta]|uniref:PROP1-like PPR domain-containing protein n=1 Tax=Colocasia esculenta TaxID=4460 RepID=A0A843W9L8_COLES|nr:hypothetical protein [Colocasia esculenta]
MSAPAMAAAAVADPVLALIQVLRSLPLVPRRIPSPARHPLLLHPHLRGFCSAASPDTEAPAPSGQSQPLAPAAESVAVTSSAEDGERRRRQRPTGSEPLHETICYVMAKRPWTTRLQNSIRSLCPSASFDRELVVAVVQGAREPDHALRFFRWVEKTGFRHDRVTYGEIIPLLTRHQMLNHARGLLLDDMPKRGVDPDEGMFAALIEGYGRAGIPQEVVKIFRRMPELGVERTARSYDAFFKAILRSGRAMMAKRFFNQMLREGVTPTLYTYNHLIWGFCLCQRMETAARFFAEMKERRITPDIVTYNTLLGGWVRAGKVEDAEKLFEEMRSGEVNPNSITYGLMIKGYVSGGKVEDGLRFFAEMGEKEIKPTEQTYSALLPGLCSEVERVGEAKKLLGEMIERRISTKDGSIYLKLISCLCEAGNLDGALEVVFLMEGLKVRVDLSHYSVLIENLCKGSELDKAVEMLDAVIERGVLLHPRSTSDMPPSAYNPVIEYMCSNGYTKKAETFFRQLMKKGVTDSVAFNNLIRGHSKEDTPESAVELLAIMNRREVATEGDAYTSLAESFLRKGDPAVAKTTLDGMIEQGHLPGSSLFRSVMEALFDDDRVQTASRLMKSMIEMGITENLDLVHRILEALLVRGHVEEALGRINLLMMNNCGPDFDSLLASLCDKDKTIAALKLAEFGLERDCDISFSSFDRVLDALSGAQKTLNAYSLLCKIKKKGGVTNKKACQALIKSLIAEGNTKQADILYRLVFGDTQGTRGKSVPVEEV